MDRIGTGFDGVDEALGGLITGDNVAWICDDPGLYRTLARGLSEHAPSTGRAGLVVDFEANGRFDLPGATRIDASPRSSCAGATALIDELERHVRAEPPPWLVVGDLGPAVRRWGPDTLFAFFERVCPAMLDAGVTAYWSIDASNGRGFVEHVRQITQCLLDVRQGRLRVVKAEGRPDDLQHISYRLEVDGDQVTVLPGPAGGRLARGLLAVRDELGLSQHDLAVAAGITPSAISQAESGARGLSLDTVMTLTDRLGISMDRLLSTGSPRTYLLSRHDRARRSPNSAITALASDATVGMRVFLIDLAGGERSPTPVDHRGVSVIAPVRGLVQVELDDDRPVLRPGDVLVVETGSVRGWRNLRGSDARCYWILRD